MSNGNIMYKIQKVVNREPMSQKEYNASQVKEANLFLAKKKEDVLSRHGRDKLVRSYLKRLKKVAGHFRIETMDDAEARLIFSYQKEVMERLVEGKIKLAVNLLTGFEKYYQDNYVKKN